MSKKETFAEKMKRLQQEEAEREKKKTEKPKKTEKSEKPKKAEKPKKKEGHQIDYNSSRSITIEIDWNQIEKHICTNHAIKNGYINEAKVYQRFFKPAKISGKMYPYGRDHYLYSALKDIIDKLASKAIKKVIREDII